MSEVFKTAIDRRTLLKGAASASLGFAASGILGGRAVSAENTVIVTDGGGAWGAAQKAAYFDPFEKETGIKVSLVPYALPGKVKASIEAGAPVADVADLSGSQLPSFARAGLLEEIDTKFFAASDLESLLPIKADRFGIPSLFGAIVVAFEKDAYQGSKPTGWADFWNAEKFPGPRSLADGGTLTVAHTFEIALLADGVSPDKLYPIDWERAFKSLDRIRPNISKFWTGFAEPVQLLVDQSATLASAYNGRVTSAQSDGAAIDFTWDQAVLGWDHWVVPKGATNVENAFKFIAYATRADRQAEFAKLIDYGPTNARAYDLLTPERAAKLPTSPAVKDKLVITDFEWWASEASSGVTNEAKATQLWEQWLKKA
ncbi:ABC transporter substrate-binding protein [Rhizobium sp. Rhizsp82]|uniref:ABC transporter substrate-binding protein n=1 Tax=Rhizobium sp. Rhizsp82 TaxID=3243057 RepID=UPI0039B51756